MANEIPVVAPETIQPSQADPQIAQNFDNELDAALSKTFSASMPEKNETPKQEPAKVEVKAEAQIEDKPEAKPESKKADKLPTAEKPLLTPDEIDKTDPKKQDGWTALKNNNKRSFRALEEKDAEIAKLKAVVAERGQMSQKELDALKAENGELAKYRAMIDIEADPEFISKFDQPIESIVTSLKGMIRGMGVNDETLNQIDFSNTKLMDEIIGNIGETRDKFVARKMERMVDELLSLKDKRDETLSEQKNKYKETLEAKKKEAFQKSAEGEGRIIKHLETISAMKDKAGNSMFEFLNKKQPKETATQPEIDQINAHNKMVDMMQQKVQQAIQMNEPEQKAELAVAAAGAHYLSAQLRVANNKIQSLQSELQKISAVNTETERTKPASVTRNGNGKFMDTDEALAAFDWGKR